MSTRDECDPLRTELLRSARRKSAMPANGATPTAASQGATRLVHRSERIHRDRSVTFRLGDDPRAAARCRLPTAATVGGVAMMLAVAHRRPMTYPKHSVSGRRLGRSGERRGTCAELRNLRYLRSTARALLQSGRTSSAVRKVNKQRPRRRRNSNDRLPAPAYVMRLIVNRAGHPAHRGIGAAGIARHPAR